MKKRFVSLLVVSLLISSCSSPTNEKATALCNCYKSLHGIDPDEEFEKLNYFADSCKTLHISILKELESNPDEKANFDRAYNYCQNEK